MFDRLAKALDQIQSNLRSAFQAMQTMFHRFATSQNTAWQA